MTECPDGPEQSIAQLMTEAENLHSRTEVLIGCLPDSVPGHIKGYSSASLVRSVRSLLMSQRRLSQDLLTLCLQIKSLQSSLLLREERDTFTILQDSLNCLQKLTQPCLQCNKDSSSSLGLESRDIESQAKILS